MEAETPRPRSSTFPAVTASSLEIVRPFFDASSAVVVGASSNHLRNPGKPLYYLSRYGYAGKLYAVNPTHREIFGCPSYPSVADLPEAPDLAILMLPAQAIPNAIRQCGERGIRSAVIFANGFAEAGNNALQQELTAEARRFGVRFLGPNCLGAVNVNNGLTATFSTYLLRKMFKRGPVGLLTQSGAVGNAVLLTFQQMGIGISKWVATGNEANLGVMDFAEYVLEDPETKILAFFLESTRDGWRWPALARRARELGKPIIALKAGRGERSQRAATSHSGKMVGAYGVWHDLALELGIIAVETLEEFCDAAYALSTAPCPRSGDVGVFCGSGGLGVLISDECERSGVLLAELAPETRTRLREILPAGAGLENPIDPTPVTDEIYFQGAQYLLEDPNVSAILVIVNSLVRDYQSLSEHLRRLNELAKASAKLLTVSYFSPADRLSQEAEDELSAEGIVILPDPVRVVRGLAVLRAAVVGGSNAQMPHTALPNEVVSSNLAVRDRQTVQGSTRDSLGWTVLGGLLSQYGISAEHPEAVVSPDDAERLLRQIGGPVVLKLDDPALAHKTEAGAIRLDVETAQQARRAYGELAERVVTPASRVVMQRQVRGGIEVLVGCLVDPEFGRVITVGAGGILAELFSDVSSALCPLDAAAAGRLLSRTRVYPLLTGFRGGRRFDVAALADLIARVSQLFMRQVELVEFELNPVIVLPDGRGALAVDVLGVRSCP